MADFLVMARRHFSWKESMTSEEREKYDQQWQPGDLVDAFPDGKLGPHAHSGGVFYVLRVPDMLLDEAKAYITEWREPSIERDEAKPLRGFRRRRYHLHLETLDRESREKLERDHELRISVTKARAILRDKHSARREV